MASTPPAGTAAGVPPSERLVSLDALRGFDMVWIAGADSLGGALGHINGGPVARVLARQLDHADWAGFHFEDFIFPLFVFLMGVAIPFSLSRMVETSGRPAAVRRIFRRAALLFLLGVFYYGGLSHPLSDVRWLGVLQRFGLCYLGAGLLFLYVRPRGLVAVCAALLVGYWALLTFVPVPGVGAAHFAEGQNLANWFDRMYLPGRKWDGDHDPEGFLSTFPAVASCLLGVFCGLWLRDPQVPPARRAAVLAAAGAILLVLGAAWGIQFPVIKKLWTSSFVLVAGGFSALAMAAFYLVIDVWRVRAWAAPFVWVGANSIAVYLLSNIVDFGSLARRFVGGNVTSWLDVLRPGLSGLAEALFSIFLCFAVARFLYRRKIFIRL
jgi:predicted acyltransferase